MFRALLCFFLYTLSLLAEVDLTIFSYDRPMQLYALLESIDLNVSGLSSQTVIYRASTSAFEEGYLQVKRDFPHICFKAQSHTQAAKDFKPLVLESLFGSSAPYALFAVDDIIVTRPVNLKEACKLLEARGAYAFFFRLGLDITYCYMTNTDTPVPQGAKTPSFFEWYSGRGKGDWAYPNNVDFTLYRKKDIEPFFRFAPYTFPNDLEATWAYFANPSAKCLCPLASCIVNIPMNVVSSFGNRQMHFKDKEELLALFSEGYKIDISSLQGIAHNSPHSEIIPEFVFSR